MMLWHVIEKGSGELFSTQIVPFAKCFYAQITSHKHLFIFFSFLLLSCESLNHFRAVCTRFKTRPTKKINRDREREGERERERTKQTNKK